MKTAKMLVWIFPLALLAGCFTISRTQMPVRKLSQAPDGKNIRVSVSGFAATLTEYTPIYGYETHYVPMGRRRGYGGGYFQTVHTETYIPQVRPNEAFLQRAQTAFEDSGFLLRGPGPTEWSVEVTFSGPYMTNNEKAAEFAWMLCSLFTTEYSVQTWSAKLKIYEVKTGRLAYSSSQSQKFEDYAFSPLPLIGLTGYSENSYNYMQTWCLTALTDWATAEATAYIANLSR